MFKVETWNEQTKCVCYHEVVDAIDYEDAEQVVTGLHPEQKILAVIKYIDDNPILC